MPHRPEIVAALAALGLAADTTDTVVVRRAFAAAIRAAHPDHSDADDAAERSAVLITAYRLVTASLSSEASNEASTSPTEPPPDPEPDRGERPAVTSLVSVVADDTIEVAAPPDLAFAWLVQAGHTAGDVTFLDRSAAMLQILISFVDEPVCQMIFDLQGRAARGTTEIFCTIDSIEDRPAPPIDAVTRFVADAISQVVESGL